MHCGAVPSAILRSRLRVVVPVADERFDAWMDPFDPEDRDCETEITDGDEPLEGWLQVFDPADYEVHRPMDDLSEEYPGGEVELDLSDRDEVQDEPGP